MKFLNSLLLLILSLTIPSCASKPSRPSLYPNQAYKDRGEKSNVDIDECLKNSENYIKTPEGEKLVKSYNGSSISTSIGLGFGGFGSGVGLGVGVGDRGYKLSGEEEVRRNYTNQCLVNKGYQIVGWGD